MKHEMTYLRPEDLAEAIAAFDEAQGKVGVLCGGAFDRSELQNVDLLIDIQNIRPTEAPEAGNFSFGPGDTLGDLQQALKGFPDFDRVVVAQAGLNVRNTLSLFNFLKTADGRSPLLIALLSMNVVIRWEPDHQFMCLEEYIYTRNQDKPGFWSELVIEAPEVFVFDSVARTPLDKPIVALAMTRKTDGQLRVAGGGSVNLPISTEFGADAEGGRDWVRQVFGDMSDAWASCTYRQDVALVLYDRLLEKLNLSKHGGAM